MKKIIIKTTLTTIATLLMIISANAQITHSNTTLGTIIQGPGHIDRTFDFTAAEFGSCSLVGEVELSLRLILGDGTPCAPVGYGVHEDLNVRLVSPYGTAIDLVQDKWGYWTGSPQTPTFSQFSAVAATVLFDDDNTTNISSQTDWMDGTFAPHNSLSDFDGEDAVGTWTLRISDGAAQLGPDNFICFIKADLSITCQAPICVEPEIASVQYGPMPLCLGNNALLFIDGDLNDATEWHIYSDACEGTLIGTTTGSLFNVLPTATTTYYVSGEGGCISSASCYPITVVVDAVDDDGDGVMNSCDICFGDDASGDMDNDGICDNLDSCPGIPGTDADGDGYCSNVDCDDTDPLINPGMPESPCNGIDDDCEATTPDDSDIPSASNPATINVECVGDVPAPDVSVVTDAVDNCSTPTVSFVSDVSDNLSCPETITRTYLVQDFSGNSMTVQQLIVVMDVTAPTASNPVTMNFQCPTDVEPANPSWVVDEIDNCTGTIDVFWLGDSSDGLTCPETITRKYRVMDGCGNYTDLVQLLIVHDTQAPTPNDAILSPINNTCPTTVQDYPTASDNCSEVIIGVPDVIFPISAMGTTLITWTYTDNCGNTTTQLQEVNIDPIDVSTTISNGQSSLIANSQDAAYQWLDCNNSNQPIIGETNQVFEVTSTGDYAVAVTKYGCTDTSDCISVFATGASNAGIDEMESGSLILYPNPTNGMSTFAYDGDIQNIEVIDMLGRVIEVPVDLNERSIDGTQLSTGKYMVRIITNNNQVFVEELVIQK